MTSESTIRGRGREWTAEQEAACEAAFQVELQRGAALEREFGNDRDFLLHAVIMGWSLDEARAEYQRRQAGKGAA